MIHYAYGKLTVALNNLASDPATFRDRAIKYFQTLHTAFGAIDVSWDSRLPDLVRKFESLWEEYDKNTLNLKENVFERLVIAAQEVKMVLSEVHQNKILNLSKTPLELVKFACGELLLEYISSNKQLNQENIGQIKQDLSRKLKIYGLNYEESDLEIAVNNEGSLIVLKPKF